MTLAELLASKKQGTGHFPGFSLADLLARRNEPLDAKFNPSGVGPGVSYGSLASILADFAPGIGDVKSAADAIKEAEAGNYGMSLADAFGTLPLIGGMGAIKAFHGSPHKFDAFDMSKIGTGEGAQAYGHGLYFAESPEVADAYRPPPYVDTGYRNIDVELSKVHHGDWEKFKDNYPNAPDRLKEVIADIESRGAMKATPQGHLYETSLEWPDPASEAADPMGPQHFLDWDKPLSEQPYLIGHVQGIKPGYMSAGMPNKSVKASDAYYALAEVVGDMGASDYLKSKGIPGIRYLDQGSRGAGDGTYNYVVFDDKIPRIISRNGVTLADLLKR